MTLIYLRTRRLIPFVVAHWAVDMIGILTAVILPMLGK
jgi:membrane protease YdiL (CAAX protease family)